MTNNRFRLSDVAGLLRRRIHPELQQHILNMDALPTAEECEASLEFCRTAVLAQHGFLSSADQSGVFADSERYQRWLAHETMKHTNGFIEVRPAEPAHAAQASHDPASCSFAHCPDRD